MTPLPRAGGVRARLLAAQLDQWRGIYHHPRYLSGDPLLFVHRYTRPEDKEVVALIAAAFASGNIKAILAVLESIFSVMGPRPAAWLADHSSVSIHGKFAGIGHRWVRPADIEILMTLIGGALREHGSLGNLWTKCDTAAAGDVYTPLARFVDTIMDGERGELISRRREVRRADGSITPLAPVESILLTSPEKGSACKRMALFLRWMIRPDDGIDTGLWTPHTSPSRLIIPLDVHVMRIARTMRLTKRPTPSRRAAEEVTEAFRRLSPEDPCRWDFCLVRVGIANLELGMSGQ